jgi:Spy/CpxP family protein refolding chaperone
MKHSKALMLATAAFVLALSGASYANDGQSGKMDGGKGGWHQGKCQGQHPQFSTAQRELLKSTFEQTKKENKPLREQLHKLRKEQFELTQAATFDQQAFINKGAEMEQVRDQIAANRVKAFAAVAPQFSPEERKFLLKMAMRHKHHHRHGGKHHHHWGHRDGGKPDGNAVTQPEQTPAQ